MEDGLAAEADATPEAIAAYYDTWAASANYENDVISWGYAAPRRVAGLIAEHPVAGSGPVLDAGCGTGMVGASLHALGITEVTGGDFTPASVEAARARGVYTTVDHLDLNDRLNFDDNYFAGVVSVGVFSYLQDTAATIAELLRVTRPGGVVIFTQRTDLWALRDCDEILAELEANGSCTATTSEPLPYLPDHPEFGAEIGIIYTTLTKL